MFGLGFGELLIVLVIVLFFFGGKKLPQLGASMGESIRAFKKGMKDSNNIDDDNKKS
jgi:sec-independent protein translocase protein TatA